MENLDLYHFLDEGSLGKSSCKPTSIQESLFRTSFVLLFRTNLTFKTVSNLQYYEFELNHNINFHPFGPLTSQLVHLATPTMSSNPLNNQSNPGNPTLASSSAGIGAEGDKSTFLGNLLSGKTPAVANIEAAYSRAGATNHHTPGHASALGSQSQDSVSSGQGVGSEKFRDGIQDQREEVSFPFSWLWL